MEHIHFSWYIKELLIIMYVVVEIKKKHDNNVLKGNDILMSFAVNFHSKQ